MKKWKKLKNNLFLYLCRLPEDGMSLWTKIRGSWFFVRQEFCVFPLTKTFYGIFNCLSIWSTFSSTSTVTVTGCNTNCSYSYFSGGIKVAMLMRQKREAYQRSASQVDEEQTFHDERRQRLRFGNNVCWKKQVQVQFSQQHELHCTDWGSCIPGPRRGHSHSWQKNHWRRWPIWQMGATHLQGKRKLGSRGSESSPARMICWRIQLNIQGRT